MSPPFLDLPDPLSLLDRDTFRQSVFRRDGYKCVNCGWSATSRGFSDQCLDAHHIIERRLWDDGGYYLDNGATLCSFRGNGKSGLGCHMDAEQTVLTCDAIRAAAGINRVLIPDHLYDDQRYDKWGNILLPNGNRVKGELFFDESVRKVLEAGGVLPLFQEYVKYPRTYHLPWSPGFTKDDRVLQSVRHFENERVIITQKMDGENTTMYPNYIHARSLDSGGHPSRGWVKSYHALTGYNIPQGWRICGENLYAQHTLPYNDLPSYFLVFSIWNEFNECVSWDETVEYAGALDLEMVPVLYDGIWDMAKVTALENGMDFTKHEGYVVRLARSFKYGEFRRSVAKYVRKEHVGTSHNWMMQAVVKNKLKHG